MMTGLWECRKIEEGRDGEERKKKNMFYYYIHTVQDKCSTVACDLVRWDCLYVCIYVWMDG